MGGAVVPSRVAHCDPWEVVPVGRSITAVPDLAAGLSVEWQQRGSCRSADTALFFPPSNRFEHKPDREVREARAKRICHGCPVRVECLEWALTMREPHGVWGGRSESERKQMILRRM